MTPLRDAVIDRCQFRLGHLSDLKYDPLEVLWCVCLVVKSIIMFDYFLRGYSIFYINGGR